jgi:hypothetical protein
MHTHPAMVAIFLTDQHSRHTYSDKTTEEMKRLGIRVEQIIKPRQDHPDSLPGRITSLLLTSSSMIPSADAIMSNDSGLIDINSARAEELVFCQGLDPCLLKKSLAVVHIGPRPIWSHEISFRNRLTTRLKVKSSLIRKNSLACSRSRGTTLWGPVQ